MCGQAAWIEARPPLFVIKRGKISWDDRSPTANFASVGRRPFWFSTPLYAEDEMWSPPPPCIGLCTSMFQLWTTLGSEDDHLP